MGHHQQKAASCINIPPSRNAVDNNTSSSLTRPSTPTLTTSNTNTIPLPSYCLYSKRALINEYAPESDIIQYLSPKTNNQFLKERLPMFVGVLQSLFTVVNDMPFFSDEDMDDEGIKHDMDDSSSSDGSDSDSSVNEDTDANVQRRGHNYVHPASRSREKGKQKRASQKDVSIIGLQTLKLVVWNQPLYLDTTGDLSLVIIVAAQLSDSLILRNMEMLKQKCMMRQYERLAGREDEGFLNTEDVPVLTSEIIGDQLHSFIYTCFKDSN